MATDISGLYQDTIVWDAHAGVFPSPQVDLSLLKDWHDSGVNYVSINVGFDVMEWQQTLATLAAYRHWMLAQKDKFKLVGSVDEIEQARQQNKLAVSFDIEGMNALNDDIHMLGVYHALGVRQMLFAYNLNNNAAGGCHDKDTGLSLFGKQIVEQMNHLGIIVDCSHAAYRTTMDIMSESHKPVVFSHSNPTAVCDHQRNIKDDQIKACAQTGGVVGVNGMGIFLGDNLSNNETLIKHIVYLSELVGADHVGIGFDYSPPTGLDLSAILSSRPDYWPAGQCYDTPHIAHASPAQLQDLSVELQQFGFHDAEIRGILGANFHRVASQTWVKPTAKADRNCIKYAGPW